MTNQKDNIYNDNSGNYEYCPKISIIIPAYNIEDYIGECLDSVVNQTYRNIEIIVVNDGSKDSTPQIIDKYASQDDRIRVVHKTNGGLSSARNAGLDIMTGEYVSFIDGDDYVESNLYQSIVSEIIDKNRDVDIIQFGHRVFFDKGDNEPIHNPTLHRLSHFRADSILENLLIKGNMLSTLVWDKLYKVKIFDNVRFSVGRYYEDLPASFEVLFYADSIIATDMVFYNYRRSRSGSISYKVDEKLFDENAIFEEMKDKYASNKRLYYIIDNYSIDRLIAWYVKVMKFVPENEQDKLLQRIEAMAKTKRKTKIIVPFGIKYIRYKIFVYYPGLFRTMSRLKSKIK